MMNHASGWDPPRVCAPQLCQGFLHWRWGLDGPRLEAGVVKEAESRNLGWGLCRGPSSSSEGLRLLPRPPRCLPGVGVPSPRPSPGAWVVLRSCQHQGVVIATAVIGKQRKPSASPAKEVKQSPPANTPCLSPSPWLWMRFFSHAGPATMLLSSQERFQVV